MSSGHRNDDVEPLVGGRRFVDHTFETAVRSVEDPHLVTAFE